VKITVAAEAFAFLRASPAAPARGARCGNDALAVGAEEIGGKRRGGKAPLEGAGGGILISLHVHPAGGVSILDIMHHIGTYYINICITDYASHLITRAPPL
jgi:hypothetical protein